MSDFLLNLGDIKTQTQPPSEWSIDWGWYDEIVAEDEKILEEERQRRANLLVDFDELEQVKQVKESPKEAPKHDFEKDLLGLFDNSVPVKSETPKDSKGDNESVDLWGPESDKEDESWGDFEGADPEESWSDFKAG